jgi:hypothetical protein
MTSSLDLMTLYCRIFKFLGGVILVIVDLTLRLAGAGVVERLRRELKMTACHF